VCLLCEEGADEGALSVLAQRWNLTSDPDAVMALVLTPERLELRKRDEPKLGAIYVDFVGGTMAHRRKFGGGLYHRQRRSPAGAQGRNGTRIRTRVRIQVRIQVGTKSIDLKK
jgi:hypothetical protein